MRVRTQAWAPLVALALVLPVTTALTPLDPPAGHPGAPLGEGPQTERPDTEGPASPSGGEAPGAGGPAPIAGASGLSGPEAAPGGAGADPSSAPGGTAGAVDLAALAAEQVRLLRGIPVPEWPYDAVHMSWPLGDVDADGADDVLWETYCVDIDGCTQTGVPVVNVPLDAVCYPHEHHIQVLGGRTGDALWERALDQPHPDLPYVPLAGGMGGCVVDAVLGTIDGDILLYTWSAVMATASLVQIEHTIQRLDGAIGSQIWSWHATGSLASAGAAVVADAVLAVPVLQAPPAQGLDLLGGMQPGLAVRAIGYATAGTSGIAGAFAQSVQPQEWAAGIDLASGSEQWRTATIQPDPGRRIFVSSYEGRAPFVAPLHGDTGLIATIIDHFAGFPCCYDLSGDGVPDLLLGTLETPITGPTAPALDGRSGRLVLFDGTDGSRLWELEVSPPDTSYCGLLVSPLADVDGDGAHDLAVRASHGGIGCPADVPFTITTVRSGKDASALWSHDTRDAEQSILLMPLGDVQGDGAIDLLRLLVDNAEPGRAGITTFQEVGVGAVDGATGEVLWQRPSFAAALDLALGLISLLGNGLPDSDRDGIADVWLDRLDFLEDQTVVHHLTLVSGQSGTTIHAVPTVGAFAIPLGLRDVTGDGREDHAILQGDVDDIWVTTYDGASGRSEWSRRVMSLNATNALLNIPLVKLHSLRLGDNAGWDAMLGLTFFTIDLGGGRGARLALTQQHLSLAGGEGSLLWSIPTVGEGDASLIRKKPTPAVQAYEDLVEEQERLQQAQRRPSEGPAWAVPAVAAGLGLAAAGATVFLLTRRRG